MQASVDALQESLKMRIKVMALVPQSETLLTTAQRIVEEVPDDRSPRDQEKKLEELEHISSNC